VYHEHRVEQVSQAQPLSLAGHQEVRRIGGERPPSAGLDDPQPTSTSP
jgi:hypothetical protein